ncbi:FkbM family methyltransferase [Marinactinospora thermotolerans]|uniref:FkbM family methyltransferase n=1 Tax=Marinactinospora thermotolerans TaxID=531310 RepID=UPI003D8E5692
MNGAERSGAGAVVDTDIGPLELPRWDTMMLPWFRKYGEWEPHESALVDSLLRPGDCFVDIGAHVGYYTIRALRRVGGAGAVFAVEPWPVMRLLLERNVAANASGDVAALHVVAGAAWHCDVPLRLALDAGGNSGDSRIARGGAVDAVGIRLDGLEELRERRIAVVKTDAQGRDHHALRGLQELLGRDRPHVLCEFWPRGIRDAGADPFDVLSLYRSWGYDPVLLREAYACPEHHPCLVGGQDDARYVAMAEQARGGFATLWLRPAGRRT